MNSLDEIGPLQLAFINSTSRFCVAWYYDAGLTAESSAREMLSLFMSLLESEDVLQRSLEQLVVPSSE